MRGTMTVPPMRHQVTGDVPLERPPASPPVSQGDGSRPHWLVALGSTLVGGIVAQLAGVVVLSAIVFMQVLSRVDDGDALSLSPADGLAQPWTIIPLSATIQGSLAFFAVLPIIVWRTSPRASLGLYPAAPRAYFWTAAGLFGVGPSSALLAEGMRLVFPELTLGSLDALADTVSQLPTWLLWPYLALLPGVCEELMFRGLLQRAFGGTVFAAIAAGTLFALYHIDPPHVAGVLPIGIFLSLAARSAGSTYVAMVGHVSNNTLALFAAGAVAGTENAPEAPSPWLALVGLIFAGYCLWKVNYYTGEWRAARGMVPPPETTA